MNKMDVKKIRGILRLKFHLKLSHRTIGRMVSASPGSISRCTAPFGQKSLEWSQLETIKDEEIKAILSKTHSPVEGNNFFEPDFGRIYEELKIKTVTLQLLWEEYRETYKDKAYGRASFFKMYNSWRNKLKTTMRQSHKAGEKLFIDYAGSTIPIFDAQSGEIRTAQIFIAVMGASSYTFAEATWTQTLADWISSHVRAFSYFGGVPFLLVPDNLKSCSTKACKYKPEINNTYAEMVRHYNTAVLPARPRKPRDKAKAEIGVQVVGRWILAKFRHQKFFSLLELNQAITALLLELNEKPFQKLTGSRLSQFTAIDKPALKPLPIEAYIYAEFKKRQLGFDYHIEIDGHYYSAPYELTKQPIEIRVTENVIEIFNNNTRVASHVRSYRKGAHTTLPEHMPKKHLKHMEWTPGRLLNWANTIGPKTFRLTKHFIETKEHPEQAYRACLGLLNLCKKYGEGRLEAACNRSIHYHIFTRRSVAAILKNGLDKQPLAIEEPSATKANEFHKNIRGPNYFKSSKTQENLRC